MEVELTMERSVDVHLAISSEIWRTRSTAICWWWMKPRWWTCR